jgi:hypothetical protein
MRLSNLFGQILREAPPGIESASHQLLLRAGFIRQPSTGIFTYLSLVRRSIKKIEAIVRHKIDAIGRQEILMPFIHPAEPWQETGRWYEIGSEMGQFKDKNGRDMGLAMTHEEAIADLVRSGIQSWRLSRRSSIISRPSGVMIPARGQGLSGRVNLPCWIATAWIEIGKGWIASIRHIMTLISGYSNAVVFQQSQSNPILG